MSLDLFSQNVDDAVAYAARASAPELPSTFSENFTEAWHKGYLTSQSIAGGNRRATAVGEFIDDAVAKTGDRSLAQLITEGGGFDTEEFNRRIAGHRARQPDLDLQPITDEAIQARADDIGRKTLETGAALDRRERTLGGSFGQFTGAVAAGLTDPVNVVAFPLAAPESLGVLGTALAWSAIGGGSQAVIEALNAPSMERIQPGYLQTGAPIGNILESAAFAGGLGGSLKALAAGWTRAKTGAWPRTIRDAGNVVESEAQIAATNPIQGVEGEAVHRTALQKAIDDLASGRPVDVEDIVPGSVLRGYEERLQPTLDALTDVYSARNAVQMERAAQSAQVQPELPFAGSIAEGQEVAAVARVGQRLEDLSKETGTPISGEEARALADRLSRMPADDVPAALDEFFLRPTTLRDTLPPPTAAAPRAPRDPVKPDAAAALRDELAPTKIEDMRADTELPDTVGRDLDKLMLERPDLEVPTGVTVDAEGRAVPAMQKVEDVIAEADSRLAAADEIMACVGPYPAGEAP